MTIRSEARRDGFNYAPRRIAPRQALIISVLREGPATASEVADALGFADLNAVKPRLHELLKMGVVREAGARKSTRSPCKNTVYEYIEKAALRGANTEDGDAENNATDNLPQKGGGVNDGTP